MILTIFGLLAAATGVSGTLRLKAAQNRHERAIDEYNQIQSNLGSAASTRDALIKRVGALATTGVEQVLRSQKMLSPLRTAKGESPLRISSGVEPYELALRTSQALSTEFYAVASVTAGVATAGALWLGASVLGISSTGMPIVYLHGAALHNAALACLGGGSLISGGGGMVAGGAVLASAVMIPAGLYFGYKTHGKAEEVNDAAEKVEVANKTNLGLLQKVSAANRTFERIEQELSSETVNYEYLVSDVRRKLFRLGVLSHWFRLLRSKWWGSYYNSNDMLLIDDLSKATTEYTELFQRFKRECSSGAW